MPESVPVGEFEPSGSAAKFGEVGDKHVGRIIAIEHRQQTDLTTGQPKVFASGDPMMLWVITLRTEDGETAALFAKGGRFKVASGSGTSMAFAIGEAVNTAGCSTLEVGGRLAVAHTGLSEAKAGMNAAKLFSAQYEPPRGDSQTVDSQDLFSS